MAFLRSLSFTGQLLIIVFILLLIPVGVMLYDLLFASKSDDFLIVEIERKLSNITNQLSREMEQEISKNYPTPEVIPPATLEEMFNARAQPLTRAYPGVRLCLYVRETEKIIIHGYLHEFGERLPEEKKERERRIYKEAIEGISAVLAGGVPITRLGKTWDDQFLERLVPVKKDSQTVAVIWAEERMHPIFARSSRMRLLLRYATLGVFGLGVVATLLAISNMVGQVRKIKEHLARMEENIEHRVPEMGGEIGQISRAVNQMASALTEKEKLIEQYRRSENLTAMGRLVTDIAHELRAPVNIIQALAQVMEVNLKDVPQLGEYVRKIEKQVARHNKLINELLDFGRPGPAMFVSLDLNEIIESVIAATRPLLYNKNIRLEFLPERETPLPIQGDREKLSQVLINLIINALDAMAQGGTLTIQTYLAQDWACVLVRDTGKGIPAEEIPKIFEPFYTRKAGGSGLGLAVSQRIVQIHGGSISVESQAGTGTTFTIRLPLAPQNISAQA